MFAIAVFIQKLSQRLKYREEAQRLIVGYQDTRLQAPAVLASRGTLVPFVALQTFYESKQTSLTRQPLTLTPKHLCNAVLSHGGYYFQAPNGWTNSVHLATVFPSVESAESQAESFCYLLGYSYRQLGYKVLREVWSGKRWVYQ